MTSTAPATRRDHTLDGLRGFALLLVVLSHGWALWPMQEIEEGTPWGQAFRSGNLGVTIFLVVGGYLLIDGFMRMGVSVRAGDYGRAVLRRIVRIAAPVLVLLLAILVMSVLDETDDSTPEATRKTVWSVATFTWNWYLQNNALVARSDLGHLWYVSIFVQVTLLLTLLFFVLRRHLWAFTLAVGVSLGLVVWWRSHLAAEDPNPLLMLLRTTTRMDGMLWGALLAGTAPWWKRLELPWRTLAAAGMAGLLALTVTAGNASTYFGWQGQAMAAATALTVAGMAGRSREWWALEALSFGPLAWLGRNSLTIYIWHYPFFFFIARHTRDWSWPERTGAAFVLTALISHVLIRMVERPLASWLRTWRWTRPDSTMPEAVTKRVDAN